MCFFSQLSLSLPFPRFFFPFSYVVDIHLFLFLFQSSFSFFLSFDSSFLFSSPSIIPLIYSFSPSYFIFFHSISSKGDKENMQTYCNAMSQKSLLFLHLIYLFSYVLLFQFFVITFSFFLYSSVYMFFFFSFPVHPLRIFFPLRQFFLLTPPLFLL